MRIFLFALAVGFAVAVAARGLAAVEPAAGVHGAAQRFAFGLQAYDVRLDDGAVKAAAGAKLASAKQRARVDAAGRLAATVAGVKVDFDPLLGAPHFIRTLDGSLTPAAPGGLRGGVDAMSVLRDFTLGNRDLLRVDEGMLADAAVTRDAVTAHNGLRTLWLQQRVNGVEVYGAELRGNVAADGRLITLSSTMIDGPADGFALDAPALTREEAIVAAGRAIGLSLKQAPAARSAQANDRLELWHERTAELSMDARTKFIYFPLDAETLRPAYEVWISAAGSGDVYEVIVDAADGRLLSRRNMTLYGSAESATYRVFTGRNPAPMSPGPSTPNGAQGAPVERELVTIDALDLVASPEGWLPPGATDTRGNNVDAHADVNADNNPDLPRPAVQAGRVFDYPLDLTQAPSTYRNAAIVNLFYLCNWHHDRLHQLGFTEPFANFQNNNFGRGGLGNDAIVAQAQDGAGVNNAQFFPAADGTSGRVQMYIWSGPNPDRDGCFDAEIVIHELAHGTSTRLHGSLSGVQAGGMGEGWGDFFALTLLAQPDDDPHGVYAMGAYATYLGGGSLTDNYYFGIRRFPYSTDMSKSPLTFADIDANQFGFPAGTPRNPVYGSSNPETVHNLGEIWCSALWECRANMVEAHGFAGNERMMRLVVDGMKLSPPNPSFLQARDAILLADGLAGGEDRCRLWAGFAKRGMGVSAVGVPASSASGVVEAFDTPEDASFVIPGGAPTVATPGEASFDVRIMPPCSFPLDEGSERIFVSVDGGPFMPAPLEPHGDGMYTARIAGLACGRSVSYYLAATGGGQTFTDPQNAPAEAYALTVFTDAMDTFDDDMETDTGWVVGAPGDDATTGVWERVTPVGTAAAPATDVSTDGTRCWVTGNGAPGGGVGDNDIDGGTTTLTSPVLDATGGEAFVSYWRWYSNDQGAAPGQDSMPVEISNDGGSSWTLLELVTENTGQWVHREFRVADFVEPTSTVRIRFIARDLGAGSVVEAGVDEVRLTVLTCVGSPSGPADLDGDGQVGAGDLAALLGSWGPCAPKPAACPADLDGDGQVGASDLAALLGSWG